MNRIVYEEIKRLADEYMFELQGRMDERIEEMQMDDNSHYLIYRVLGVTDREGELIDVYQNKGRFLYKYAGSFLETATIICINYKYPDAKKCMIDNTIGSKPKRFEIDCLVDDKYAIEIKWRDATTDGDHITKEHTRVKAIQNAGFIPIRVMFYYPNRTQAIRIQETLETLYNGVGGEYYYKDSAWDFIEDLTGINLLEILERIADERE